MPDKKTPDISAIDTTNFARQIVLDFEFAPVPKQRQRRGLRNEIIEVGAVKLDYHGNVMGEFSQFVQTEFTEGVAFPVRELTGISAVDTAMADPLYMVVKRLSDWIGRYSAQLVCWSGTDRRQLLTECQAKHIDPLSEDDPSGSQVSHTITKTAMVVVIGILVLIVGMQIGYGVMRRLNTANLSESVSVDTVSTALKGGLEWGNGFTQFPLDFTVDEADERTGTVEVTVLDTSSANELELLSNGQIQAAALATNALLNDKIDRVVYNVHAYIDEDSNIQHDSFFGMFPARGHQSAILTFVWTKSSSNATSIDWKMRIVSMDDTIAERIQKQVNSVSSLIEDPVVSQTKIDEEKAERDLEHRLHGREIFRGGKPDRTPSELLEQDKKK